ncbi:MAG: YgiT-type zinc finger protein [Blastocatellia bacterium]|nr:YgiT-type zinc finger protein [Blastocatellia bacterium]
MRIRCSGKCPGTPEPGYTTQTFERRGSPVRVTISNIPAAVCPVCHESYVDRQTARQIDLLIEPFHGKHGRIPSLPPAEVAIDFARAIAAIRVA